MKRTRYLALVLTMLAGPLAARGDQPGQSGAAPLPQSAPMQLAEAARRMTLPEGFAATLFAGEPDVRQPIAFTIDHRGRLWVAENYTYPDWLTKPSEDDRIVIFEDADGDGRFDRRTVFWQKRGANLTGLAIGFGGVWACATPHLLFIPDKNGDDIPDGEPVVKLDGWDIKAGHTLPNALNWGPDGWLWGCNGIQSKSRVGRPGTPDDRRVAINCGVWRFHPTRDVFEAVAHGTTNPWGLDFDDHGEAFITNCVLPHLYRVVPGAHFQRMYGQDFNPHAYGLMESCADHLHWAGGRWQDSRDARGKHGEAGGGHAHTGAMIYLGDNWPDRYRDSVFMCNIHGHRVNNDRLARKGSGYVARHGPDFLMANDAWFRGMELKYGPDGAVFVTDWCDTGECHETDADLAHRENGRIFKITYGQVRPVKVDLAALGDEELVRLQLHKNDWYVRNARRLLQERAASGKPMADVHRALWALFHTNGDVTRKLRALWVLHATGGLDAAALVKLLDHPSEYVRSWAVRLLCEDRDPAPTALAQFEAMARRDPSPLVRLSLASALQRIPPGRRRGIAEGLVARGDDARDQDIPLMLWYGIEPLIPADRPWAVALASRCQIPLLRRYLARRVAEADAETGVTAFLPLLEPKGDPEARRDFLDGMLDGLRGRKDTPMPSGWPAAFDRLAHDRDAGVRELATLLALRFNDPHALTALRATLLDAAAPTEIRERALQALVERKVPGLPEQLRALLDQPAMRRPALRALAVYDDEATPRAILDHYPALTEADRTDAIATLAARPASALALLDAVEKGVIPRRDVSTPVARQLQAFGNPQIAEKLDKVWGVVRPTAGDKAAQMAKYKALLSPEQVKAADPSRGRLVFGRACAQCHRLYEAGGEVGPDLTGSDRANLQYILENVLDPSAAVARDFTLTTVATTDGRLISGIIREQGGPAVVVQTPNERLVLPKEEIEAMKPSPASMMPEGLLDTLSPEEIRDLIAYLATSSQVPPPAK